MTDNKIIKALECCNSPFSEYRCCDCPLDDTDNCKKALRINALNLINRQKAEIRETRRDLLNEIHALEHQLETAKAEAIKEFAKRLKSHSHKMQSSDFSGEFWDKAVLVEDIDNLVKEMAGDTE